MSTIWTMVDERDAWFTRWKFRCSTQRDFTRVLDIWLYINRFKALLCSALSASTPKLVSIVENTWFVNFLPSSKRWYKSSMGGLLFVQIVEYDTLKPWFICLTSSLLFIISTDNRKIKHQITHYNSVLPQVNKCTSANSELVLFDCSLRSVSH